MPRNVRLVLAALLTLGSVSAAQELNRIDVSVGYGAGFSKTSTSSNGTLTLKPTASGAFLGTFRYRFNRMHGLAVNLGHTSNSQHFFLPPNDFRVQTGITEFSGAYVFTPLQTAKLEPFLFGGAGGLRFNPGNTYLNGFQSPFPVTKQTALAFLYGGGVDYHLWRIFALRLQYRGVIYKAPNFGQPNLATNAKGHLAEPAAGIVVKF